MEQTFTIVESSNIHSVAYDPESGKLFIRFKNKAGDPTTLYEYSGVPSHVYEEMLTAPSVGRYFSQYVRGIYESRKVEG